MYSFGGSIQDEVGNVVLNSKQSLEAVKFVKALYKEAMNVTMPPHHYALPEGYHVHSESHILLSFCLTYNSAVGILGPTKSGFLSLSFIISSATQGGEPIGKGGVPW